MDAIIVVIFRHYFRVILKTKEWFWNSVEISPQLLRPFLLLLGYQATEWYFSVSVLFFIYLNCLLVMVSNQFCSTFQAKMRLVELNFQGTILPRSADLVKPLVSVISQDKKPKKWTYFVPPAGMAPEGEQRGLQPPSENLSFNPCQGKINNS